MPGSLLTKIRGYARKRKISCEMTIVFLERLWDRQGGRCAISGLPIKLAPKNVDKERTASLDRIDNSKGYIKSNVHWVHKVVNGMKSDRTLAELIHFCRAIARHSHRVR